MKDLIIGISGIGALLRRSQANCGQPAFLVKPQIDDIRVVAVGSGRCLANFESRRQVDRRTKNKSVLFGKRRQSFQHRVGNEWRHLPNLKKVIWILYPVNDKIRALAQDCL